MTSELETRYGRKRGLTPVQHYAVIALALAIGTVIAYLVFRNSEQAVQAAVDDVQVISNTQVIIQYEVHKPSSMTVTCDIRSRDGVGAEVGRKTLTFNQHQSVVKGSATLTTKDKAVDGEIVDCALVSAPATGSG